jgi:glycosyltransferase involved in cell wall biosynthesis
MMKARGHYIIHYGHEESDVVCDEHVTVTTNEDLETAYGNYDWRNNFFKFNVEDHAYKTFYKNAIEAIAVRKQPRDFILPFWGSGVRPVCDAHPDMICVEPGIGYAGGHWARWKIFESYAVYHAYCNMTSCGTCKQDWYEAVIPNYFDLDDFEYSEEKDDYFLFLGRVYEGKGIHIAVQMTKEIGVKLVVAGQQSLKAAGIDPVPSHVVEVGYADRDTRKRLMSRAKCGIVASMYLEPFGGVQMEMLLSGTPTITTDWGSFTENNIHGLTGYRCRTFEQFCWAGRNIDAIKPSDCRKWALNFRLEKVAKMYEEYFQMVHDVYTGEGWYQKHPERQSLEWLEKTLPTRKKKVAIVSEKKWAFGRIHYALIKYMKQWYDFEYFDWGSSEDLSRFYTREEWKHFDIVLGNSLIASDVNGWFPNMSQEYLNKCVAVVYTSAVNHPTLRESIAHPHGPLYCGINQKVIDVVHPVKCELVYPGVDLDHFFPTRTITEIKRAGVIGNPDSPVDIKRLDMFRAICEKANIEPVFIHGRDLDLNNKLYEDIDLFVLTSLHEGAFFEAACCDIPVIVAKSEHVESLGIKSLRMFDTVDEAVDLVRWLGENVREYTLTLSAEIRANWDWKVLVEKYWKPVFEKRLAL